MRCKVMPAIAVAVAIALPCWFLAASRDENKLSLAAIVMASENSRIIAELQRSVEKLERSADETLEQEHFLEKTLILVPVVVNAYNLIESQIDSTPLLPTANK